MSKIRVKRTSQYANFQRPIKLFSNNIIIGELRDGESKEFTVPSGVNKVLAKIDWCRSNVLILKVSENETPSLELGCNMKGWKLFLALFWVIFYAKDYLYIKEL